MTSIASTDQRDAALREQYARDGYVTVDDVDLLGDAESDSLWDGLAPTFARDNRVQDAWPEFPIVRTLATHPSVMATLRVLYGREPVPFQTLNFLRGSQQRTHSDTLHFSSFPSGFMCGVWVAMEDVTLEQGPLHYYPGSQTLPEYDYEQLGIPVPPVFNWRDPRTLASYLQYEDFVERTMAERGFERRELALKRGSYLVWSANLFHGGSAILDPSRTRKSQVTHYYFADTVGYTPMFSRRSEGRFLVRPVKDISTGTFARPSLDGEPVLFEWTQGGLHKILPATSLTRKAQWHLTKRRPLPGTVGSMLRYRIWAMKHAAFRPF